MKQNFSRQRIYKDQIQYQNNKAIVTKIYKTKELDFKDADQIDFLLWLDYVQNENLKNDNFSDYQFTIEGLCLITGKQTRGLSSMGN